MKRTSFLLASLTAILLLSCGFLDNSDSSAEEMDYPKANALNKAALSSASENYTAALSSSSMGFTASKAMSVAMKTGETANSNELEFKVPSSVPTNAIIRKIEVYTGSSLSATGTPLTNSLKIRKGASSDTTIYWGGAVGKTIETNYFNNDPARDTYYVSFNATCLSGAIVSGVQTNVCSKSYNNVKFILYYYY